MKLIAKPFRYAVRVSLALAISSSLQAADIVTYDFTTDADPNTEASNTSSSTMDPGSDWGSSGRSSFSQNFFGRGISTTPVTSYVGFTITADSGYTIDLTQLDFDYHFQQSEGVTSDQVTFEVRSSVDSFASAIPGTYSLNPAGVTAPYEDATFDLSGGSYDGLSSIEFRLYATNDTETVFNDIVRWDNITVSGTVASTGPDTTPPAWETSYPQVSDVATTSATARARINEAGTAYYVVVADGASAPSSAQIKAGNDAGDAPALDSGSIALTGNTENTAAITGLTPGTAYDIYFVAEDDETPTPNLQTTPELVEITTLVPDTTAPSWTVGYPQVDGITTTSATARTAIDEPGTAYYVVVADGATAPSSAQVKAGNDAGDAPALASGSIVLAADTEDTAAITGLAPGTAYDIYFVAEDDETPTPNSQTTPELVEITTLVPDTTAPAWTVGYPQVDGVTTTSATARTAIDEPGTAYYVVVADGATAPDSAQVKAGVDYSGVTVVDSGSIILSAADTEDTAAITGLAPGTAYDIYFVAEDDETPTPNLQATPELVEITTLVPAPTIVFYDFSDTSLDNPTTEASNTGSSIVTGTGFGGSGRSSAGNFFGRGVSPTVLEDYISFTITADTGFILNLDQLEFDYYVQQDQNPPNSFTFETRSSVDGFASAISGTYSLNPATSGAPYEDAAFDLTGASYQDLSSIEFRLYAKSDGAEQFNDIVRWDNITVSGSATSGGGNTFASWIDGWGLDAADKDFTDDPDGDGLDNGVEAFFGTNPADVGQGLTQVTKSGNLFSVQHPEADPALSDVTGSYEWSLDLQNWFPQGTVGDTTVTISTSKDDPVTGTTTVTADTTGSTTAPTKLFLRVVATQ